MRTKSDYSRYQMAAEWSTPGKTVSEVALNFRACGFATELDLMDGGLSLKLPHYKDGQSDFYSLDLPEHVTLVTRTSRREKDGCTTEISYRSETATLEDSIDAMHVFKDRQAALGAEVIFANESNVLVSVDGLMKELAIKEFWI